MTLLLMEFKLQHAQSVAISEYSGQDQDDLVVDIDNISMAQPETRIHFEIGMETRPFTSLKISVEANWETFCQITPLMRAFLAKQFALFYRTHELSTEIGGSLSMDLEAIQKIMKDYNATEKSA